MISTDHVLPPARMPFAKRLRIWASTNASGSAKTASGPDCGLTRPILKMLAACTHGAWARAAAAIPSLAIALRACLRPMEGRRSSGCGEGVEYAKVRLLIHFVDLMDFFDCSNFVEISNFFLGKQYSAAS